MSAEARRSEVVRRVLADTSSAVGVFEARWTIRALQRISPDIYRRLLGDGEQRDIFERALLHGDADEIELHGAALCRGWAAATKAMEAAGAEDDAYLLGVDQRTGAKVAIGEAAQGAERVRQIHGDEVVFLTPDEVATLWGATQGMSLVEAIKLAMPGAELTAVRPATERAA